PESTPTLCPYTTLFRSEEAIQCLDRLLELQPDQWSTWLLRASWLAMLGMAEQAIQSIDRGLEWLEDPALWTGLGQVLGLRAACLDRKSTRLNSSHQIIS